MDSRSVGKLSLKRARCLPEGVSQAEQTVQWPTTSTGNAPTGHGSQDGKMMSSLNKTRGEGGQSAGRGERNVNKGKRDTYSKGADAICKYTHYPMHLGGGGQ